MRPKPSIPKKPAERVVKDIRRTTRRHFFAEDKIRMMRESLNGEAGALKDRLAELTLKNRILLENYFPPGDLEAKIAAFVEH